MASFLCWAHSHCCVDSWLAWKVPDAFTDVGSWSWLLAGGLWFSSVRPLILQVAGSACVHGGFREALQVEATGFLWPNLKSYTLSLPNILVKASHKARSDLGSRGIDSTS